MTPALCPLTILRGRRIEASIRQLDGKHNTLLILAAGDTVPHMGIGGGAGNYVVYTTHDNIHFTNLVNPSAAEGPVDLITGGQKGTFAARGCVDLDSALEAARQYFLQGQHSDKLTWEAS